ncbi:MAG: hypothetical protein RMM31_01245 [Anaerolineae bacterium]|nr:hypothetical protein [Anaerolineae bacterium]
MATDRLRTIHGIVGGVLLVGHFAPWAAHHTAALTLSAHDLAVFTNDTPGAGVFLNEWFLLPLWAAALLIPLNLRQPALGLVVGLGIAALGLPGYPQILVAFRDPEHQLRFFASVGAGLGACLLALKPPSGGFAAAAGAALCLVAAVPLGGYLVVRPMIEALYGSSVGIGLGWWLTLGSVAAGVGASSTQLRHKHVRL